jgi:CRISPR-associated protein Cas2
MRNHYIVSYDICDATRLRRVHKTVRDFGDPLQLSVFYCQLSGKDLALLRARLRDLIDHTHDQILFVDLGRVAPGQPGDAGPPRCRALGRAVEPGSTRVVVV